MTYCAWRGVQRCDLWARLKSKRKIEKLHASKNWPFVQTTHDDIASWHFARGSCPGDSYIYFKFHENRSRGIEAVGVKHLHLPLTWPVTHRSGMLVSAVLTATSQSNGSGQISTPHIIQTPLPITTNLCTFDYVYETNTWLKICANRP